MNRTGWQSLAKQKDVQVCTRCVAIDTVRAALAWRRPSRDNRRVYLVVNVALPLLHRVKCRRAVHIVDHDRADRFFVVNLARRKQRNATQRNQVHDLREHRGARERAGARAGTRGSRWVVSPAQNLHHRSRIDVRHFSVEIPTGPRQGGPKTRTRVMLPKRSCPAMSHSWSRTFVWSSQLMSFSAKSTPASIAIAPRFGAPGTLARGVPPCVVCEWHWPSAC